MTSEERSALLEQLRAGKVAIASEVEGLSDAQAGFRAASGAWSIVECVEHVALAETGMFIAISRRSTPGSSERHREEGYFRNSLKRTRKFEAFI